MILHVLDALAELRVNRVVVVVGHRAEWVTKTLVEHAPASQSIEFVEQAEHRGTGEALAVALTAFPESLADQEGDVLVLPGDTPLVRPPTLAALVRHHRQTEAGGDDPDRAPRRPRRLRPGGPGQERRRRRRGERRRGGRGG